MHKNSKTLARAALGALLAACALAAQAQTPAGTWMVNVGATRIKPNVSSGTLTAPSTLNTQIDVDPDTRPTITITRMLTDNWSVELPIATPFRHRITGAGGIAGVGQIGSVRAMPLTVFAQYRFLDANARIRPYAMLGLTYAHFQDEHGSAALNALNPLNPAGGSTGLSVESKFALTPGLGATAFINDKWFVDAQYARTLLKTRTTLSTGQTLDAKLNPDTFKVGIGMRF